MLRVQQTSQNKQRPWRNVSLIGACLGGGMIVLTGCGPSTLQSATSTSTGKNQTTNLTGNVKTSAATNPKSVPQPAVPKSSFNTPLLHVSSVDMVSQNDGWATGMVGGKEALWRSHGNGLVWSRVDLPFQITTKGTNGFATSSRGTNTLFIARKTNRGVQTYVTTNGGKSWARQGLAHTNDKMVPYFHFATSTNGWMVTDNGVATVQALYHIYRTTNGGKTWRLIAQTKDQKSSSVGHVPGDANAVFSFHSSGIGWMTGQSEVTGHGFLMRSSDGGKSWRKIAVPVPKSESGTLVTTFKPITKNGKTQMVVQYQGHNRNSTVVMQLNDHGKVVATSPPLKTHKPVVTDFVNAADGWATTAPWAPNHPLLYRTTNGGQSWESLPTNQKQMWESNAHMQFVTPTVGFAFDVNQNTQMPILWMTRDGGQNWRRTLTKVYVKGGPTPPGQNPPPPAPTFAPQRIAFVSDKVGYLSGNYGNGQTEVGRVYKTTDGGKHWTEIYHGGQGISAIDAKGNKLWIDVSEQGGPSPKGKLMRSTDGGQHFSQIDLKSLRSLDFISTTDGWAVSESDTFHNQLLHTTDGGRKWGRQPLPSPQTNGSKGVNSESASSPTSVSFANAMNGLLLQTGQPGAGSQLKSLLGTQMAEKKWSWITSVQIGTKSGPHHLSAGGYAHGIDVVPGHPSLAYIWESRGPLLFTSDGGKTWTASKLTKPDQFEANWVSMLSLKDGYVLIHDMEPGHQGFILEKTTDGMKSWTQVHQWT